jgi:hypothetical protein
VEIQLQQKANLLDKIIAQGGPVLGLFSRKTATVNGYLDKKLENCQQISYVSFGEN